MGLHRSLRYRLAAAFLVWTVAFQILVFLLLPLVFDSYAQRQADQLLLQQAGSLSRRLALAAGDEATIAGRVAELDGGMRDVPDSVVQVRRADGSVLASTRLLGGQALPLPASGPAGTPLATQDFRTLPLDADGVPGGPTGRFRIATVPIDRGSDPPLVLQVGRSTAPDERLYALRWRIRLFGAVIGLLGGGLIGLLVASLFIRRLEAVARAVREASPTRLEQRVMLPEGDDEIGRLAHDINQMLDRLAQAFSAQDNFISDVSHELKTPISVLMTEAQVLRYVPPDQADYKGFAHSVEEEMRRLGRLVGSFLMLARVHHGRRFVGDELVPINDAAIEGVEHAALLARHHQVNINLRLFDPGDLRPEALVRGDGELIRVVIDNVLRNAIQVSPKGAAVDIRVTCTTDQVVVTVEDRGPGISAEHLGRIFERFAEVPSAGGGPSVHSGGRRRGTGLGLTIARSVVDLHGGTLEAGGRDGGGCTMTVRLPLARPASSNGFSARLNGAAGAAHASPAAR